MVEVEFSVEGSSSVFTGMYPGIPKRGQRVVLDGVDFIISEDGVVHVGMSYGPKTKVTCRVTSEWAFQRS